MTLFEDSKNIITSNIVDGNIICTLLKRKDGIIIRAYFL